MPGERDPGLPGATRGRTGRVLLVVAVVAVECAWLVVIAYGVWRLALLL